MDLYFAYGSNMRSARLAERIGSVHAVSVGRLEGWDLRFDKPGRDGTGKANLVRVEKAWAWGVAYALPDDLWPVLDRFEPGYRRVRLALSSPADEPLEAQVYLYTHDDPSRAGVHLAPSARYLAHLIEGAREHRLPAHYLERIRSAARGQ
jgi:gamma-glutamylcyclotransferase